MKIIIDPGHGPNYNPGAVAGYYEGNAMYELATYLRDELLKYADVEVAVTRKNISEHPDLKPRTDMAKGADLFLSLHSNAHNTVAQGVVIFYSQLRKDSKTLATNLCNAIVKIFNSYGSTKTYSRGAQIRLDGIEDYYHVVRDAVKFPSVKASFLIEHGFHDNLAECKVLKNTSALKSIARAEAEVIAAEYGLNLKSEEKPSDDSEKLFRVQVGAFGNKKNADNMRKTISAKGYNPVVVYDGTYYRVQCGAFKERKNAVIYCETVKKSGFKAFVKEVQK